LQDPVFLAQMQLFLKQKKLQSALKNINSVYATTKKRKNSIYGNATFSVLEIVARKALSAQNYYK